MGHRTALSTRKRSGKKGFERDTEVKKKLLKKSKRYTQELIPAAPDVLPYDEYIEIHGVSESAMKKAGHYVSVVKGHRVSPPARNLHGVGLLACGDEERLRGGVGVRVSGVGGWG